MPGSPLAGAAAPEEALEDRLAFFGRNTVSVVVHGDDDRAVDVRCAETNASVAPPCFTELARALSTAGRRPAGRPRVTGSVFGIDADGQIREMPHGVLGGQIAQFHRIGVHMVMFPGEITRGQEFQRGEGGLQPFLAALQAVENLRSLPLVQVQGAQHLRSVRMAVSGVRGGREDPGSPGSRPAPPKAAQ